MFAIEATNLRNWRWIAGIFQYRCAAEAFLQSVPEAARVRQHIVALPFERYPLFIVEKQGFEYGDIGFLRSKLTSLVPHGDEDHVHMNVYAVREDFVPDKPGIDAMGGLLHWHITDWMLQSPGFKEFDEALGQIAGDADSAVDRSVSPP